MRYLFTLAAVAAAATLTGSTASAQYPPAQDETPVMYQPADYSSLLSRIENLEASQASEGINGRTEGAFYTRYESVIVKPILTTNSALSADIDDTAINVPFDLDLEYSPRIEAGYIAPTSELGWRARYWHFNAEDELSPGQVNPLLGDDGHVTVGGSQVTDIDTMTGTISYELELNVVDLEATRATRNGTLAAGLRFASINQDYRLGANNDSALASELDVTGIGPTLAYEWRKGSNRIEGLSWLAGVRGSLLYGNKDVETVTENFINYYYDEDVLFYSAEAQLGTEYRRPNGLFLRLALEAQYWGNVGNLTNEAASESTDDPQNAFDKALGFVGLSIAIGKEW